MGQPVATTTGDRRLQREKRFWRFFAIVQFFILLWMVFNANNFIDTTIWPPVSKLRQFTGYADETSENSKSQFNSSDLEMFQSQTKVNLVREIRDNWVKAPSELPYNITPDTTTDLADVKGLHKFVLEQFGGKTNGFFIECGAFDGTWLSNTLHLEQEFNWTGLLIEADPISYRRLLTRQRKAWTINACLPIKPYEENVRMTRINNEQGFSIISELAGKKYLESPQAEEFEAQCFPLTSILAALRQTVNTDYFSLDVGGAELNVLQVIPWDFVYIKVISLSANERRAGPLVDFLAAKNYEFLTHVKCPWIHDYVFVHKQFKHNRQFVFRNEGESNGK